MILRTYGSGSSPNLSHRGPTCRSASCRPIPKLLSGRGRPRPCRDAQATGPAYRGPVIQIPLTPGRWLTGWSVDVPMVLVTVLLSLLYLSAVRKVHRRGGAWPVQATAWFLVGGLGSLLAVTCSFLGTYSRVLFWPLAVQDVLLLTLVPVGLTLGRPVALFRAAHPRSQASGVTGPGLLLRVLAFPLTGSVIAVGMLLAIYTSGWDQARLEHRWLLEMTRCLLLLAGCGFLWPLLGVDEGTGRTSYPVRAVIAFLDGLLDALPGLAVLGSGHVIAADYYTRLGRSWGPAPARAQQIGGTAMIALSELVGLPALLVLLVAWVRSDAGQARSVDADLDAVHAAEHAAVSALDPAPNPSEPPGGLMQRPWWEVNAGPLADRAQRYGWAQDAPKTRD